MKQILKYKVPCTIPLPANAKVCAVRQQVDAKYIWIELDTQETLRFTRTYKYFPTGVDIPDSYKFIGTVFEYPFVWHIYEVV